MGKIFPFSLLSHCSFPFEIFAHSHCDCVLLNPIRKQGGFQPSFSREPRIHTKLADVPSSIPAALSLHTRNGKALCGCTAGCSELKPSGGTWQVLDSLLKVRKRKPACWRRNLAAENAAVGAVQAAS